MARVLVTGGAGFIGSHLVDALVAKGHAVSVVDDLSVGHRRQVHRWAKIFQLDIRSPRLTSVFRRTRPEVVFHLAAQKNLRTSVEQPSRDAETNIIGGLRLLEACHQRSVKKLIFASTAGVYAEAARPPLTEHSPIIPPSPYGVAKLSFEHYLGYVARLGKVQTTTLRYANVYGPRQDPDGEAGVVAVFIRQLVRRRPLFINGHGRQTRDYIYVADVVRANLRAMSSSAIGVMNIGTGQETSVNALAQALLHVSGRTVPVRHRRAVAGETKRSALNWNKAHRVLDWKPVTSLQSGLRRTWLAMNTRP